jgi:fatty acid desaturase
MGRERLALYDLVERSSRITADGAELEWFRAEVPHGRMRELMRRSDYPALRDTALWLGGMLLFAALAWLFWGGWMALPFLLAYGLLYGTASDSRWHECAHGTPFKTRWVNEGVYGLACFFRMQDPTVWRWQHTRHHTDTIIVGRDPEITVMRPARLARLLLNFFGILDVPYAFGLMVQHSFGSLTAHERAFVPPSEGPKVFRRARAWLAIYVAVVAICLLTRSVLPLLLIGGPRMYGNFLDQAFTITQHTGLGENVIDHRLNTRTIYLNRLNRFLYWNMNYHVEHHMFPMVPYHRLPDLHREIQHELAAPYPSMWAAYREIIPAIIRQLKDQTYFVRRELPPGATPFKGPIDGFAMTAERATSA